MDNIFGIPANTLLTILLIMMGFIVLIMIYSAWRYPLAFRLGVRNIPRRKSQTALIIGGLALSTLIITSALGVGDTIDYSVRSDVYANLGGIDEQIGTTTLGAPAGLGFGGGSAPNVSTVTWFSADVAADAAALVDGETIDGVVAVAIETLPVLNTASNLSEAAVQVRGLGEITGSGLTAPAGLANLADDEVLLNESLAEQLNASTGDELMLIMGRPTPVTVAGIVPDGELAGSGPTLIWTLDQAQVFLTRPGEITDIFVSNAGNAETGVDATEAAITTLSQLLPDTLSLTAVKADQLETAASSAEFITTLFVTFGTFSIFSGILLIFLIFSVLAAERKSELGMGRAVGLQRADLVRQFVSEGLAYNFLAALIGAFLGILASLLLARLIADLLSGGSLNVTPYISPRSVVIGYSLGVVVTFVTVSISAIRISNINIIAAIRDLNLPNLPRESQWTLFLHPFLVWRAAIAKAGEGNRREALRLFLVAGPKAILSFWGGLLARGPVLLALGYAMAWVGVNVAEQSGVYGLGVSLFLIGLGQLLHWIRLSARLSYSLVGLSLILYWSLPTREVGRLADLNSNPGDFFISGIFLVGGAIILFLYNADSLLNLFAGVLGRMGRLLPVARMSIAYPVNAKGRTATTLAMFSLIIFTLVGTITITNTFSNFLDPESGSGGYDVLVQPYPFNPVSQADLEAQVAALVADGEIAAPEALAAATFAPVTAKSPEMADFAGYAINGVDAQFLATQKLELANIADGYDDPAGVWAAIQSDPTLVVVDNFVIDRSGDPTYQPDEDTFAIRSISAGSVGFAPVDIEIMDASGEAHTFTVIGVLGSAPSFFGALMNSEAAAGLGYDQPNRFFIRVADGEDVRQTANVIEGALSSSGVQTTLMKAQLEQSRDTIRSVFYLIQGFIGLGLLVGVAALGVIMIRSVVERRQQIGVLRAIGFQRSMVQGVFLFEGFFIAGLGTFIGYVLALTFAYNLYLQVAADQGLAFLPPWAGLAAIAVIILAASLVTSWLPARATAKVTIAEALRYE